jgi:hypothetical protein
MQHILKAYLKRLTDLTTSNKSLLLLQLPAEQFMDLHELDYLTGKPSFDLVAHLIAGKPSIPLCDVLDSRYDRVNEAGRKLAKIARTSAFIEAERGTQDLYVGYPMVRGKLADGTPVRCPLLFFPVKLEQRLNQWTLRPREGEEPIPNKSFLLAYGYFSGIAMPDEWLEMNFAEFSSDPLVFRTQLYEKLKESPLEINYNPETFTDKLQPFQKFTRADFEGGERNGEIKLYPEAVLGIFPQAGSWLVPDYHELIERDGFRSPEDFFYTYAASLGNTIPAVREEALLTPFALDAWQEKAILTVKSGGSLVVQGPPGTGKSQLICNLIADYTARGKKVLLVCQKRAALDVVHARLKSMGLADFAALVHDFRHDRKAIYSQIASQVSRLDEYKRHNASLDTIMLEREFLQESRKIDRLAADLEEFRKALFDASECGLTVKELYLTSQPDGAAVPLKKEYRHFQFDAVEEFRHRLSQYEAYATRLEADEYVWKERVSFARFSHTDLVALSEAIAEVPEVAAGVTVQAEKVTGQPWTLSRIEQLDGDERKITNLLDTIKTQTQWEIFQSQLLRGREGHLSGKELDALERRLLRCLKGVGIDKSLDTSSLEGFSQQLKKARRARQNWFRWQYWRMFDSDRTVVRKVADSNELPLTGAGMQVLAEKVQNRIRAESLIGKLQKIWPAVGLYEEAGVRVWFSDQRQAAKARKIAEKSAFWQVQGASLLMPAFSHFQKKMFQLFSVAGEWVTYRLKWHSYLTERQIITLLQHPEYRSLWKTLLQEDFDPLIELDRLKENFTPAEKEVVIRLMTHRKANPGTSLMTLFDNSLRLAWIEHIEGKYPVLRSASTLKLTGTEKELQMSLMRKTALSCDVVLLRLREQTYRHLEENRLGNRVTYRDLEHQVTKKRNIWPVRKLLTHFNREIFDLVPCWMASPESVSALFPLEKQFDLVIFDEASQCFAERGIPAMYRGHQTVVTGDDKQLPPGDLYRIRFEEEGEHPDLETDSLLGLASRYFAQMQLGGHYRSQSLELIDFSNRHFYGNTLQLLPDFQVINRRQPAIRYLKTEGIWEKNTNQAEADTVARLVLELLREGSGKEIGVVTFNFPQQQLILDVLEAHALEAQLVLPESLFVKNLENVQGDERDIIIFSIGYAPDEKGRLTMQFGSLNQAGGENRLNVAVTRAREQIYVVSSLLPGQLRTEESQHDGPKLLKKYLEYAWQVSEGGFVPAPKAVNGFASNQLLKDKLLKKESEMVKELPFADLTIKKAGRYESLLLTDDDLYFASLSAKDAHAYMPFLLTGKNWPFRRVYSREWWKRKLTLEN